MGITVTVTTSWVDGVKRWVTGTWTLTGGSTSGDIVTGLSACDIYKGHAAMAGTGAIQITASGGTLTITSTANSLGIWFTAGVG